MAGMSTCFALIGTEYGRLLTLKLALFAVILVLTATNRLWLTPRRAALAYLRHRARLGLAILAAVGMLGTLH
jgi:putative copper resistance protein D